MKNRVGFGIGKKSRFAAIVIGALLIFTASAEDGNAALTRQIREVLQQRVELLSRLAADHEKQFADGSLGGEILLETKSELYTAKLLLMKAEMGHKAVPGIAAALLRSLMAQRQAEEVEKNFSAGLLAPETLLKAKLAANDARLRYLQMLQHR